METVLAALLGGAISLAATMIQQRHERKQRAGERADDRRHDDLAQLTELYEHVLKLCFDVRASFYRDRSKAPTVDDVAFRTCRARLMLRAPKEVTKRFVAYLDATNAITTRDPNDYFNPTTHELEIDWTPSEAALEQLRDAMALHLDEKRALVLTHALGTRDERRLGP